ncbi:MAG: aminotransferase class V-fold PLP-dependent enzyme [Firmicutes bacterium]|nr:aminotransferase class V-fold PLP-dependent enzyme [Bacillota bacterium]
METPIFDFVQNYKEMRLHMPGHKGKGPLGIEALDITEVKGADSLYEAEGIIAQSEKNVTRLFGTRNTLYSSEGSSQCIRAMVYMATYLQKNKRILAARNVHKAFVYAASLCDAEVDWLYDTNSDSLCACQISKEQVEQALQKEKYGAVYLTSPDYLGNVADIQGIAQVCHKYSTLLLVDNAHGAYLHFLEDSLHPMDLGADLCCDSAHKTLPVLTGGAYLHVSKNLEDQYLLAKHALSLFGSTSPSYLILSSLDCCNAYLENCCAELKMTIEKINRIKEKLVNQGWDILSSDPLKLTIRTQGNIVANLLREHHMECEYSDDRHLVLMLTGLNDFEQVEKIVDILKDPILVKDAFRISLPESKRVCSIREAVFAISEEVALEDSLGRICATPTVSCPPAIPIVVSGEVITREAIECMKHYHIENIQVIKV